MIEQIESAIRDCQDNCTQANYCRVYALLGQVDAQAWSAAEDALVQGLVTDAGKFECAWSLTLGMLRWNAGRQTPQDFLNVWNTARFAGIPRKYSQLTIDTHLSLGRSLMTGWRNAVPYILVGNLLRLSHKFSEAQDVYLAGLLRFPGDPFLKLRLADLYLASYQIESAQRLLRQLQPVYPYAREMMFLDHEPGTPASPVFGALQGDAAELICFIAADPVYVQRYAVEYARSLRQCVDRRAHVHLHIVRNADQEVPPDVIESIGQAAGVATLTQRILRFDQTNANWAKALYASERFLVLAELLEKYNKPVLVSDIDVVFLRDPLALLARLGDHDFMYTNFRDTNEAWERYAATVMLVRPSPASIAFFKRMAATVMAILQQHAQPWFVDQIALFKLIESGAEGCKPLFVEGVLSEAGAGPTSAYFRTLHASWQ